MGIVCRGVAKPILILQHFKFDVRDKPAIAPLDSNPAAVEDDFQSGFEEGTGEGNGEPRIQQQEEEEASGEGGEEGGQFDLPEYSDKENLVGEATEELVEENLVQEKD